MQRITRLYDRIVTVAASRWAEGAALLLARIALAGVFWRSGRSKIADGSLLEISDATHYLFEDEYGGVPLPPEDIPVSFLRELLGAMRQATRDLFGLLEIWEEWKLSHPDAELPGLGLERAVVREAGEDDSPGDR